MGRRAVITSMYYNIADFSVYLDHQGLQAGREVWMAWRFKGAFNILSTLYSSSF